MKKKNILRPFIGITMDFNGNRPEFGGKEPTYFLRKRYLDAVWDCGGIPVPLPASERKKDAVRILSKIDGLLLTGSGPDLPPALYGEKQKYLFPVMHPLRIQFEMNLCRLALARNTPLLGICGGLQILNVALKGSLIQDIPSQVPHPVSHRPNAGAYGPAHWVTLVENTRLFKILRKMRLKVNSSHHQAIKKPGKGLQVNAVSPDGVIEGVESKNHPFAIGVQWHPECLYQHNPTAKKIFKAFIQAAKASRN